MERGRGRGEEGEGKRERGRGREEEGEGKRKRRELCAVQGMRKGLHCDQQTFLYI